MKDLDPMLNKTWMIDNCQEPRVTDLIHGSQVVMQPQFASSSGWYLISAEQSVSWQQKRGTRSEGEAEKIKKNASLLHGLAA